MIAFRIPAQRDSPPELPPAMGGAVVKLRKAVAPAATVNQHKSGRGDAPPSRNEAASNPWRDVLELFEELYPESLERS